MQPDLEVFILEAFDQRRDRRLSDLREGNGRSDAH